MNTFQVRLVMLSDWRIGTGTGLHGLVDRAVARDPAGLPFVPAKSLIGVWRDGCEVAARALDTNTDDGRWHAWVDFVFGTQPVLATTAVHTAPRPAALAVTSAHLPGEVAAVVRDRPALRQAMTFLKPGVRISSTTGAADHRALRLDEMARGGLTLTAGGHVDGWDDLDAEQRRCVTTLLAAGARLVESIGGGRRRGAGRCRLDLDGPDIDFEWLQGSGDIPTPPPARPAPTRRVLPGPRAAQDGWQCVRLELELLTPVVVGERTVGNAVVSADHIPGRLLLPAVLRLLDSDAAHTAARGGALLVTDATIIIDGQPGHPAPDVLATDKTASGWLRNTLVEAVPAGSVTVDGYVADTATGGVLATAETPMAEYTHNTILDQAQRPTEQVGGLYTYTAIATGTRLGADLRAAPGVLPDDWPARLSTTVRLGRSSKDDFGRVTLTARTVPAPVPALARPGSLRVWLLSDLLVHDARLRLSTAVADVARVLGQALGVTLSPVPDVVAGPPGRHESWHRGWGLPRPTLVGIAAGTCLAFTVTGGPSDPARVATVEANGIGLRRGEGFGQLRLNPPLLDTAVTTSRPPAPAVPDDRTPARAVTLTGAARDMVREAERAAWATAIRQRCERLAATPADRRAVLGAGYDLVPNTQLAGVRTVVAGRADPDRWLASLTAVATRQHSWPDTVRQRLRRLLTNPDDIWDLLELDEAALCVSPDAAAQLRVELAPLARRTLVNDCLTAHTRAVEHREDA